MIDPGYAINLFERFGRQVVDLLWLPSLEALLLGVLVWVLLFVNRGCSPGIRHFLWLLVLAKPLLTLVLPWQGPFEIPLASIAGYGDPAAGNHIFLASSIYAAAGLIWMVFAGFGLYRIGSSVITMTRRKRRAVPVAVPRIRALFDECLAELGLKRGVALRVSDEFEGPALIAVGRPVIVIPSWCILELSNSELKQVLLHELTHYARRDHLTVVLVEFTRIFFFFHPAVWYAARRVGIEAERACDVAVVRVSKHPERYASILLKVAGSKVRTHWQAVLELARSASVVAIRIRGVLGSAVNRKGSTFFSLLAAGICTVFAVTPILRPTVHAPADMPVPAWTSTPDEQSIPGRIDTTPVRPSHDAVVTGGSKSLVEHDPAPSVREETPRIMVDGRPLQRRSMADLMVDRSVRYAGVAYAPVGSQRINPAVLGHSAAARLPDRSPALGSKLGPGRIEVQGVGQTGNALFDPTTVSLSAGYFLTSTHQFGGVFSIRRPNDAESLDDTSRSPVSSYDGTPLRARKLAGYGTTAVHGTVLETQEEEQADRITRIGAFYRYNPLVPGGSFTPFFGWGTGLEIRPQNRYMAMIDAGVGLRYFWERHVAVIVQASYRKELDVTSRPFPEMTLGFSAIF